MAQGPQNPDFRPDGEQPASAYQSAGPESAVGYGRRYPGGPAGHWWIWILLFLAVVGLLWAARPRFDHGDHQAKRDITRTRVISGLTGALDLYWVDMRHYPTDAEGGLNALLSNDRITDRPAWQGPYVHNAAELQDAWGRPLAYRCPGSHRPDSYDLSSAGADGVFGTEDDITNWNR